MSMAQQDPVEQLHDAPQLSRPLPLWRNRDFLLLLSGQGVSSIGSQVSQLAFPLLALALTHSPAQAGLITALRGLPYALLGLPAGALTDRWNRKRVMILCDTGRAIALASIPIAFLLGNLSVIQLALVALIEGTLFVFFNVAEASALPHVVTKEQLATAVGQSELLNSSSLMLGPSIGGFLYNISTMIPFLGDAISYAISALSLLFVRPQFQHERTSKQQNLRDEIKEGLHWLWHHPMIRFLALLTGGLIIPCMGYGLILIVIAQGQHTSTTAIGFIFAAGGVGSCVGAIIASPLQRRFGFARTIRWSVWIWALTWLLFAIAPNPLLLGILNGLSFAIVPIYMVAQYSYRLAAIPDHLRGRVNSIFQLITLGSTPLGLTLTGWLLQTIGPILTVIVLFMPQFFLAIAATVNKDLRRATLNDDLQS
jgi:MFS family permease